MVYPYQVYIIIEIDGSDDGENIQTTNVATTDTDDDDDDSDDDTTIEPTDSADGGESGQKRVLCEWVHVFSLIAMILVIVV